MMNTTLDASKVAQFKDYLAKANKVYDLINEANAITDTMSEDISEHEGFEEFGIADFECDHVDQAVDFLCTRLFGAPYYGNLANHPDMKAE